MNQFMNSRIPELEHKAYMHNKSGKSREYFVRCIIFLNWYKINMRILNRCKVCLNWFMVVSNFSTKTRGYFVPIHNHFGPVQKPIGNFVLVHNHFVPIQKLLGFSFELVQKLVELIKIVLICFCLLFCLNDSMHTSCMNWFISLLDQILSTCYFFYTLPINSILQK
jgi:hypothetical protein